MDCSLKNTNKSISTPSQTMGTDMDIVMAYHKLRDESKHTVRGEWVLGHADDKKKDKPKTITDMEIENLECDQGTIPVGFKAMLKLDGDIGGLNVNPKVDTLAPIWAWHTFVRPE